MLVLWHLQVKYSLSCSLSCYRNFAAKSLGDCRMSSSPWTRACQWHRINIVVVFLYMVFPKVTYERGCLSPARSSSEILEAREQENRNFQ